MDVFIVQYLEFIWHSHSKEHSFINWSLTKRNMIKSVWWLDEMIDDITGTRYVIHYVIGFRFNPAGIPCEKEKYTCSIMMFSRWRNVSWMVDDPLNPVFTVRKRSLRRLCSYTCQLVILFTGGTWVARGACMVKGGRVTRGACVAREAATKGGAWWRPPRTATAAGGTHPTGMHSCINVVCTHGNFIQGMTDRDFHL